MVREHIFVCEQMVSVGVFRTIPIHDSGGRSGMFGKKASPETREKQSRAISEWHKKMGHKVINHVVVRIETAEVQDVYDMTVPDAESFIANGVVVHNCLGLGHEHQNPEGGIQWNEEVVYSDLSGPPNFWSRDIAYHNVVRKYRSDQVKGTKFDPESVMLYWFPKEWTLNGISTSQNNQLSKVDKEYIGSSAMYPFLKQPPMLKAKTLTPNHRYRTKASIRCPGEEDLFIFTVVEEKAGRYMINTRGNTNVAMRLYGPNSQTLLVAEDDDSGMDSNAQITADLIPGNYFVQVRHSDRANGTGKYTVKCFHKK